MTANNYRILYICADPGVPIFGRKGCSTHVRETCRSLAKRGHSVYLIAASPGEDVETNLNFQLQFFIPCRRKILGNDLRLLLNNLCLRRNLLKVIEDFKPQIIYERYSLYAIAGERIALQFNIPRILEINAPLAIEQRDRLRLPWLAKKFENHIFRNADYAIIVSTVLGDRLLELGVPQERIIVQPIAVDPQAFMPGCYSPPEELREICKEKVVVGYVGNLHHYHRIKFLFNIAKEIRNNPQKIIFLIVGGEREKVEKYKCRAKRLGLQEQFIFTGSVNYKEIPAILSIIDIGIIPNCAPWSAPTKMFEYAAMKKTIIAPDYPAIRFFFPPETHWLLFHPEDTSGIKERIIKLACEPALRTKLGEANRQRLLEGFTHQHHITQIEKIAAKTENEK